MLIFSKPDFSENNTFLLSDWLIHTPQDVVAANFKKTPGEIEGFPKKQKYIFKADVLGSIQDVKRKSVNGDVQSPFSFHIDTLKPIKSEEEQVRIVDMSVFNSDGHARTFNFQAGDVGYVPMVAGHYVQNIGDEPLIFLEVFRNPNYSDISLNKWLATTPEQIVSDHLNVTNRFVESLPHGNKPEPIVWYKKR